MKYKAVIFDFDATLARTNRLIFDSFQYITEKYAGKIYSDADVIKLFGPTEEQILREWFGERSEAVIEDYFDYYLKNHHIAELYEGIHNLLKELSSGNFRLAIFTGKGRRATILSADFFGIRDYFEIIVSGDDVKKHKPSGEGISKIIDHFRVSPRDVLMVGDSPVDIKSATEAGVDVASVLWDSYSKEELIKMNSNYYFSTVKELRDFLLN